MHQRHAVEQDEHSRSVLNQALFSDLTADAYDCFFANASGIFAFGFDAFRISEGFSCQRSLPKMGR